MINRQQKDKASLVTALHRPLYLICIYYGTMGIGNASLYPSQMISQLKVLGFLEKCLIFFYQGDANFNCQKL